MGDRATPAVLLTGGTGFLGAAVLRALHAQGIDVVLLKRSYSPTWRIDDLLDDAERVVTIDLDAVPLEDAFARRPIEAIVHLATDYGRRSERLSDLVEANELLPLRLLELAIAAGTRLFLNTDSFSCKSAGLPEVLGGYVLTKQHFRGCGELLASASDIRFVSLRIEHAYGPRDGERKFVPTLLRALLANQESFELTPGGQVRDFVHVDDVVAAYLAALAQWRSLPAGPLTLDVGTGEGTTLASFATLARELTGSDTRLDFGALPYRRGELMRSVADTSVLRGLGWVPRVELRDGLRGTIEASRP